MAVGMCIIAVLYQVILKKMDIVYIYSFPLSRIVDVFVACNLGCLFCSFGGGQYREEKACLYDKHDGIIKYTIYESLSVFFAVISTYLVGKYDLDHTVTFLPSSLCLVYLFAVNKGYITKALNNKFLVYFGSISNFAFLMHMPVIRWVMVLAKHIFNTDINCVVLFAISLFLMILLCEVWKCIVSLSRRLVRIADK